MTQAHTTETFNPWSVVNLVFNHLAEQGLHPVLGEAGDPAVAAAELLAALGITPGQDHAGTSAPDMQQSLSELRQKMMPGVE